MRLRLLVVGSLTALALGGCSKQGEQPGQQGTQPGQGSAPQQAPPQTPALLLLADGADQNAIRSYLASVHEIKPKKFEVQWNPDVTPVSREEASRSLREISADGSEFTFATSEPVVTKLAPGRILWIWGIALRRIDRMGIFQDTTIVHTTPVSLNAAMDHADIEFDTPLDFASAYGGYRPPPPREPAPPPKPARADRNSPFRPVGFNRVLDQNPTDPAPSGDNNGAPNNSGKQDDSDELNIPAPTMEGFTGKIAGFEYSMLYNTAGSKLLFELQARREEEEGGGEAESNEMMRDVRKEFFEYVKEWNEDKKQAHEWKEKGAAIQKEVQQVKWAEQQYEAPNNPQQSQLANQSAQALQKLGGTNNELGKASLDTLKKLEQKDNAELTNSINNYNKWKGDEIAAAIKARRVAWLKGKALQVFYFAYDNFDVRFRTKVEIDRAALVSAIRIDSGRISVGKIEFKDFSGRIDFEFVARLGRGGNGVVSVPIAHVPVALSVPLVVYGVPFVAQFGGDFLLKGFWSGKHAAHHFAARYEFKGGAGMLATDSKTDFNNNLSASPMEETGEAAASSLGTSGTVWAVQAPRVGLGLGFVAANLMAWFDYVTVLTITNSAAVATLNPPCKRYTLDRSAHFGVDGDIWLLPSLGLVKKELWHNAKPWERVDPDLRMCHI